jgi:glycosyltransferase involved in cell wall biosynthesis
MSGKANISVAMAVFNGEQYLPEQLNSLMHQTLLPMELVVADDGSTDGTMEILERFAAAAPFAVRLFVNDERLGFADNFLRAARECKGDIVAFCDCDDVWNSDKLQRCFAEFSGNVVLVTHTIEQVDKNLKHLGYIPAIKKPFTLNRGSDNSLLPWNGGAAMVMRAEVLAEMMKRWPRNHAEAAREFGRRLLPHDEIAFFIANAMGDIRFVAEPLIRYRLHGANTTNATTTFRRKVKLAASVGHDVYRQQARFFQIHSRFISKMASVTGDADRMLLIAKASRRGFYRIPFAANGMWSVAKDTLAALSLSGA